MNLKIEKDLKSKRIFLAVKQKTGLSKDLMLAFCIAAGIHLTAFTLFQIDLGTFFPIKTVPAVSFVSTEKGGLASGVYDDEKQELEVPSFLQIDRASSPQVPLFLTSFQHEPQDKPFLPDLRGMVLEDKAALCKSRWHFSKGLFSAKTLPELTCEGKKRGVFTFRLYGPTIFWLNMVQSTGDLKLDRELEEALKGLQVTSLAKEGVVEVEFLP